MKHTLTADVPVSWRDAFGVSTGPLEIIRPLTGGTQNELLLLQVGDTQAVLRRGPEDKGALNAKVLGREARTLESLGMSEVAHPRVLAWDDTGESIGRPYILMEYSPGFNAMEEIPETVAASTGLQRHLAEALVGTLGLMAEFDYTHTPLSASARPEAWLERQVGRWSGQTRTYAEDQRWSSTADLALEVAEWLEGSCPVRRVTGLVHGDFHFGNFLFDPVSADVSAVVDWELATIGDPRLDFGHLLATWPKPQDPRRAGLAQDLPGLPNRAELHAMYAQAHPDLSDDVRWFYVLAAFRLATILEGSWFRALDGRIPSHIGDRLHGIAASLYDNALLTIRTGSIS